MQLKAFDHIVIVVADVAKTRDFYRRVLGMEAREERPGKWSMHFGAHKISLQQVGSVPDLARLTTPGSGNFCILADTPVHIVAELLRREGVAIAAGPDLREGALGPIRSVYFRDPDGNMVEISNQVVA